MSKGTAVFEILTWKSKSGITDKEFFKKLINIIDPSSVLIKVMKSVQASGDIIFP